MAVIAYFHIYAIYKWWRNVHYLKMVNFDETLIKSYKTHVVLSLEHLNNLG